MTLTYEYNEPILRFLYVLTQVELLDGYLCHSYLEGTLNTYLSYERNTQQKNKGIWNTKFVRPAAFRSDQWQDAEFTASQADCECVIKGNINRKGDKIYHAPWPHSYKKTRINPAKGEGGFTPGMKPLRQGRERLIGNLNTNK